jgi:outer membrane receptor protein involved in Fe transport
MTGISKRESMHPFRIILQIQLQDKTSIPNFDIEFGTYGIVSYDLSDNFSVDTGLRYDYSRVDAAKFYFEITMGRKSYDTEFGFYVENKAING